MTEEPYESPIPGMKTRPHGLPIMLHAFIGFLRWTCEQEQARARFANDTGIDLESFEMRTPMEQLIDSATGADAELIAAFADWVTENLWGEEGKVAVEEEA